MMEHTDLHNYPNDEGFFGEHGGQFIPPHLVDIMNEIRDSYFEIRDSKEFQEELQKLYKYYVGRPSPIYHAEKLSKKYGGAQIYLKREDLNHTGAHKINHCLGEALLAKFMGKKKVIAETGAGQHGVALATACALIDIECEIHMGVIDIEKEHPNVVKMKILGAKVVPVTRGTQTLKDAVDSAFDVLLEDPVNCFYAIGSVVGPHPFPMMVRDFQSIVGKEARVQFEEMTGGLPDYVLACVGGGSNAIGIFSGFLNDKEVKLIGVEPAGHGLHTDKHAATMSKGTKGMIHGFKCYLLQDEKGEPLPVHSIASGLDYPGVGPQHCMLLDIERAEYASITDQECIDMFMELSQVEGIIPALESSHAVAHAVKIAATLPKDQRILVNLSGRGDKDVDYVASLLDIK
jgi:tryptophan synthase beta chain